jgi:predicted enzyme related to lactoylglutathione lyase
MVARLDTVTFDCADPRRVAAFWASTLGWELEVDDDDDDASIRPPATSADPLLQGVYFQKVPEGKVVKNRVHLDLRPPDSMAAEVERSLALGATIQGRVDEGGSFWTVMLDPEGNEFCILRGSEDGWTPEA